MSGGNEIENVTRDGILQLMRQRNNIDENIQALGQILQSNHIGMTEPLVDREGFPRNDIDVYQVRHARHKIICLQNDFKALTKEIEHKMQIFHQNQANGSDSSAMDIGEPEEARRRVPIALVNLVSEGSPAFHAGLQCDDLILTFGSVDSENFRSIADIGAIVQRSRGQLGASTSYCYWYLNVERTEHKRWRLAEGFGPIRTWWWLLEIWTIVVAGLFLSEYSEYHFGIVIAGIILFIICMSSCFAINFGDPGVIVKPNFSEAYRNAKEVSEMIKNGIHNPIRNVTVGGKVYKYSYCMRCHHFRPPESGHCYTCDSCIERWDHHCPIFGGCVGKKNLVAFHVMCLSQAVLWTFWVSCSAFATANVTKEDTSFNLAIGRCKTLLGVTVGIIGAAVLPMILSKSKLEKNLCVPKAKPHQTSNDFSGDWSTTGIPDMSVRSAPAPHLNVGESSTEYSSSEFPSSESSPEVQTKTRGQISHITKHF
ncbi:unnamed protein product [Allacma fusca]|uniref:Palmitoyltransferase n=1 Tax=Allacma fusca TaxID=39272 RepID=A0A8J2L2D9_9HEXA|nr:unnamed protein product [Allacma fusca]